MRGGDMVFIKVVCYVLLDERLRIYDTLSTTRVDVRAVCGTQQGIVVLESLSIDVTVEQGISEYVYIDKKERCDIAEWRIEMAQTCVLWWSVHNVCIQTMSQMPGVIGRARYALLLTARCVVYVTDRKL
ncbi:hypothetical protein Tco_0664363 [Tanacetum coccineum]